MFTCHEDPRVISLAQEFVRLGRNQPTEIVLLALAIAMSAGIRTHVHEEYRQVAAGDLHEMIVNDIESEKVH